MSGELQSHDHSGVRADKDRVHVSARQEQAQVNTVDAIVPALPLVRRTLEGDEQPGMRGMRNEGVRTGRSVGPRSPARPEEALPGKGGLKVSNLLSFGSLSWKYIQASDETMVEVTHSEANSSASIDCPGIDRCISKRAPLKNHGAVEIQTTEDSIELAVDGVPLPGADDLDTQ